jgi:ABC-type lipoprotein export system ATPase subunit
MGDRLKHKPSQLSGGQRQRVAIARALAVKPSIILADEPTGNLDTARGDEIMKLLRDLNKQGITLIIITHDPAIAKQADRIINIRDGKIGR